MYPGPYPQPYGYPVRPPFRDARKLVRIGVPLWVFATIVTGIGALVQSQQVADDLARVRAGEAPATSLPSTARYSFYAGGTSALTMLVGLGGLVLVIVATFRLAKNHEALGRPGTRWTPGWAVAGWLIPLANAVLPSLQVRDLWRGSDPELGLDTHEWRRRTTPPVVWLALGFSVLSVAIGLVMFGRMLDQGFDMFGPGENFRVSIAQSIADMRGMQAAAGLCSVVYACLMAWLLTQVAQRQQVLAERSRLVGPGAPPPYGASQFATSPYATSPYGASQFVPGVHPVAPTFPPAWFADPWGRFQLRWWDGVSWTAHVSTGGATAYDPLAGTPPDPPR